MQHDRANLFCQRRLKYRFCAVKAKEQLWFFYNTSRYFTILTLRKLAGSQQNNNRSFQDISVNVIIYFKQCKAISLYKEVKIDEATFFFPLSSYFQLIRHRKTLYTQLFDCTPSIQPNQQIFSIQKQSKVKQEKLNTEQISISAQLSRLLQLRFFSVMTC